jgi:hypothetical protein
MKNDDVVREIIQQLQGLQLQQEGIQAQQAVLLQRLEHVSDEASSGRAIAPKPSNKQRGFELGDEVNT